MGSNDSETLIENWPVESDLASLKDLGSVGSLAHQFGVNKSDKHLHGYPIIYQVILAQIHDQKHHGPIKVVEIGIGSNNPKVPSNMGVFGTPGASLRALRDFLPNN